MTTTQDVTALIAEAKAFTGATPMYSDQLTWYRKLWHALEAQAAELSKAREHAQAVETDLHLERTGECSSCYGTGVIDSTEHRCGHCKGRGFHEPPVVIENRALKAELATEKQRRADAQAEHEKAGKSWDETRTRLEAELADANESIERVRAAALRGSLMDVHPTRMPPSTAIESEIWWQSWHAQADAAWRANIREALPPRKEQS